jgi:mediator of RNA polymerase II transcription subunit 14
MGFVPPETISSDKALKLLRNMNTSLSIRLTVHENLPRQMQNWRVASGRVTFIVADEFELDLLSFVEDTSEQWHFIDLRLLFEPAPSITVGSRFHLTLKYTLDSILAADGLSKCYDYLHNFILTHKINVLQSQAHELVRTGWTGSLKVEPVHRGLVIQYWTNKVGKKNWIEFGVSTGKPKNGKVPWKGLPVPTLAVRWFRQGVEVKDADFNLDWKNVSMERTLKHVIARHTAYLLLTTRQNLNPTLVTGTTSSDNEPSECMLKVSMGPMNTTTLSVEPVTGRYILQPITSLSSSAEQIINRPQDASNTSAIVTQLLARSVIHHIQKIAQQVGWQPIARQSLRPEVIKEEVGLEVLEYALYWPRGWTPTWALAVVVDVSGESWWICELGSKGSTISTARRLAIDRQKRNAPQINRTTLSGVGRIAIHTLAYHVTTRELENRGKTYTLDDEYALCRRHPMSEGIVHGWVLHLKTADLLASKPDEPSWLEPGIRVMCQGLRSGSRNIWHIASGTMLPDVAADVKKLMSASPHKNFSFSGNVHFHILLCTPFGEEVVTELKARLRDLDRLRSFATILQKRKMPLRSSSLQRVQFQYGQHLTATVKFDEGSDMKVRFSNNSPHKRIEAFLADMLNEKTTANEHLFLDGSPGLDRFCTTLLLTRPVLSALDGIASQQSGNCGNPAVHAHGISTYRITYNNPTCSFDIRLRPKEDKVWWHISDNEKKPTELRPKDERMPSFERQENLKEALKNLYKTSNSDERWYGVNKGIVASVDGVPGALRRLHETILSCHLEGGVKQEHGNGGAPGGPGPKPDGGAPIVKMPSGKMNAVGGKPSAGVKHEVITID